MRRTHPPALTLLTTALLILLPTLAVLQYRWVGQVSAAERERMQSHLENAALQFRESLDGEIARAFVSLQLGGTTARDGFSDRFTDRYDAWLTSAAHPQIVANVFLVDANGSALRLRRWHPAAHVLEPIDWTPLLEPLRASFDQELKRFTEGQSLDRRVPAATDDSLIVAPLRLLPPAPPAVSRAHAARIADIPAPVFGFSIIQLDLDYIRSQLLPELAQRYFMLSSSDGYRVAVVSTGSPATLIYASDPGAPVDSARADTSEPLFGIRGDFVYFNRASGRGDNRRLVVSMLRGRADGAARGVVTPGSQLAAESGVRGGRFDRDAGRWMLLARHQSGSLEAAVARTRFRNLGISFGILLLLSVSVGMLALSSRRAQRLARQQMEFVAGISHELRTPIAVIRSASQNLSQGVIGSPEKVRRYGEAIGAEALRLGEMVEHVLQYSGLESGAAMATRAPLSPADIIESAVDAAMPLVAPAGVRIERTVEADLPPVLGDAAALRSALQNLIANAVKYGGDDRWVGIRAARAGDGRRPEVRITVEDHGAGIPTADLPHIFDPFYRGADAVARQVQGNGLGLSIVQRIVAAHGGAVTVATHAGAGSAFTIALPVADPRMASVLSAGVSPIGAAAHS